MEFAGGRFSLFSPEAARASLALTDSRGRLVQSWNQIQLAKGRNTLSLTGAQPKNGLYFIRLYTSSASNRTLTWKAMVMGGAVRTAIAGDNSAAASTRMVLSKASAVIGSLKISKSGYNTQTYQPTLAIETGAWIYLTATTDVGYTFTGTLTAAVVSLNKSTHILVVSSQDVYCDGNNLTKDTVQDTSQYVIRSGTLYLWHPGDCFGTSMTGTSTDIVGSWTMANEVVDLPADLKTANCQPDSSGGGGGSSGYTAIYNITSTTITGSASFEECPGDYYTQDLATNLMSDTSVQVTQNTCMQAAFQNGKKETASLTYTKRGDSLITAFTYKTKSCQMAVNQSLSAVPTTCPDTSDPITPFYNCVKASGFANVSAVLSKTSAATRTLLPVQANGVPAPAQSIHGQWPMSMERKPISHVTSTLPIHALRAR